MAKQKRIDVLKTYKTYVGGKFPRTESGRFYKVAGTDGQLLANACQCSRKDIRMAVVAARSAFSGWKSRSAYNRGQILYRIAEVLEGRKSQFVDELIRAGYQEKDAVREVSVSIDRLIYYAGWTDKYQQVFSTVNPVASSHFNFSMPNPTGIVGVISPDKYPLSGLISMIAPVIAGGNTAIVLASEPQPLSSISFAEVVHASDVPGGVINILTGFKEELIPPLSSHMDVNAIFMSASSADYRKQIEEEAAGNVKRVISTPIKNWNKTEQQNPYLMLDLQETKTTWHPIGV